MNSQQQTKKVTKYDLFQRVFFKNDNNAFRTFPTT